MSSRRLILFAALLLFALLPERGWAQGGWQQFSPPDRSFSVLLPGTPEPPQVETVKGAVINTWVLQTSFGAYIISYSDYRSIPDAGVELKASLNNFLKAINGTARTQRQLSFKATRGATLPALHFTYATADGGGAGRIVVDGNRTYMWITMVGTGHDASADAARYMDSFAITAPGR